MVKRRFEDLEKRWIEVVKRGGSFTLAEGEEGDELYYYDQWKRGKNREIPEANVPNRNGTRVVSIVPFDLTLPAAVKIRSTLSGRSETFATKAILTSTFNHIALAAGNVAIDIEGYTPPRAIISALFTAQQAKKTSRITKRKYRPRSDDSYSIPFGKEGTKEAADVMDDIKDTYTTGTNAGKYGISFTPEKAGAKIEVGV